MSAEYKKLQEALITIRDECKSQTSTCSCCPFYLGSGVCGIVGVNISALGNYKLKPMYWEIPEIKLLNPPKTERM